MAQKKGLVERLSSGEGVVVAEGYLFEFESRGYLKAGGFVPEVVIEHPDLVRALHREFVHAGSDVVLAFTYYGHRQKLKLIGREGDLEKLNREALTIAKEVADETGTLLAGNICNTTIYRPDDEEVQEEVLQMMGEQVKWAVEEGVDFIVGETFGCLGEAMLALKAIQEHGQGVPSVITLAYHKNGLSDGMTLLDACRHLKEAGANVVGLNCARGPATMLPLLKELKKDYQGPLAALPVVYRTTEDSPAFQSLRDLRDPGKAAFPLGLEQHLCSRDEVAEFAREAWKLGVHYIGLCCGNRSNYMRAMAEAVGRTPPASRYAPDMTQHYSRIKDNKVGYAHSNWHEQYRV